MRNASWRVFAVAFAASAVLAAAPPELLSYQGVLRNASDKPQSGTFDMVFRFFDAATAGNEILVDSHTGVGNNVTATNGLFTVALGGGTVTDGAGPGTYTALSQVFRDYAAVWLEIKVGSETLTPRVRVQSAAYALNASNLGGQAPSSYVDVTASSQTKSGRLGVTPPDVTPGYALYVKGLATASVFGENNASGQGYLAYGDVGVWGQGNTAGAYFQDHDSSGSCYLGYGDHGIDANGNLAGGYFSDNSGDWAYAASGSRGVDAYGSTYGVRGTGSWAGGYMQDGGGNAATLGGGGYAVSGYGSSAGAFLYSSGDGYAYVGTGDYGIKAYGHYPSTAGYFYDTQYFGEASLANGNVGIVAKGTYDGGEFYNPGTNSSVLLAPNNGTGANSAAYFWNPAAPNGTFNLGVWAYVATASFGSSPSGIYTNGGKNFVQNHPLNPSRVIVYTSLEGGEAGTYTRGSGRLDRGEARVPLDPTFAFTTDPDVGLTAVVTPKGQWADLYVASVGTDAIVVRARDPQASDVEFDYIVNGLRLGFENGATVVPKDKIPNAPVTAFDVAEEKLAALPADSRASTPLARFSAGRGVDTSRARALVAKIDAPEQATFGVSPVPARPTPPTRETPSAPARPAAPAAADAAAPTSAPSMTAAPPVTTIPGGAVMTAVGERVESGDVLSNDPAAPGTIVRSSGPSDPGVIGIVGGEPGSFWPDAAPVALAGTVVRCKADATSAPIRANDLLVSSSLRGFAMRAGENPRQGTVIGT
jgi:hypothetical protein